MKIPWYETFVTHVGWAFVFGVIAVVVLGLILLAANLACYFWR